jgi:hypothetical protein
MAFKASPGLGLMLAIAAAAPGCETKPAGFPVSKITNKTVSNSPTASIAPAKPAAASAAQPVVPPKPAPEDPSDRVARLGGKIERENSAVIGIDFFGTDIGDNDLEVLSSFPDLQTLGLSGTKVTDAGLAHLVGLKKLNTLKLGFTNITDHGLITLAKLSGLQSLDLLRTKVTSVGVAELQKALPRADVSTK